MITSVLISDRFNLNTIIFSAFVKLNHLHVFLHKKILREIMPGIINLLNLLKYPILYWKIIPILNNICVQQEYYDSVFHYWAVIQV